MKLKTYFDQMMDGLNDVEACRENEPRYRPRVRVPSPCHILQDADAIEEHGELGFVSKTADEDPTRLNEVFTE